MSKTLEPCWVSCEEVFAFRQRKQLCVCSCGNTSIVAKCDLDKGKSTRCVRHRNQTHGMYKHPLYRRWAEMKQRCSNPNNVGFKYYGGRGISYHPSWNDFPTFIEDVGEPPFEGAQLDRINNDGDYEPGNVRWADKETQMRNRNV